jgi:hypothetical protein
MHMRLNATAIATSVLVASPVGADPAASVVRVGNTSEIRLSYRTEDRGTNSSGSSSGRNAILERVVAVTPEGVEYEYDLPDSASEADRKKQWFFPARVFKPNSSPAKLLNSLELTTRLDQWLASANWTHEMCGRWVFTWNAFQIVCDPTKVLDAVEPFDLRATQPRDGAILSHPAALASSIIRQIASNDSGATYVADFAVNPAVIRKQRAETDVVVGQISGKAVNLQAALEDHAKKQITGTIRITFETDSAGDVLRRTTETHLETKVQDGGSETSKRTETVERVNY